MSRNRLASASSPYLRQHKDNPVHWRPWDAEALDEAAAQDKPIFLSVGYSSCHWCHVMEHEVFENAEIADLLNRHYISIKVDREERPDLDDAYMTAVQLYNGHGGWPMTLFLTPERKPFFAGTYFPADDRGQHPGFKTIAAYFADMWRNHRGELKAASEEFGAAIEHALSNDPPETAADLNEELIENAVRQMKAHMDAVHGGFKGKPKFPPHQTLRLMLHLAETRGSKECLEMATATLDGMLRGGIHDHVGGGFHRYSTDERWLLPHFEKMLYDNAQMLSNYARAHKLTGEADYWTACEGIVNWIEREMTAETGLCCSALDADTEGEEGLYYTWTWDELSHMPQAFLDAFGVRPEGNFNDEASGSPTGRNILHRSTTAQPYQRELAELLERRRARVAPGLDDKCLIAWNGLLISGLAEFGKLEMAERIANVALGFSPLPHQVVNGVPEGEAFLDASYLVQGLLDLAEATGDEAWRVKAASLFEKLAPSFRDETGGGWYFTSPAHERLFGRAKSVFDGATPSPSAVMTLCAVRLGRLDMAQQDLEAAVGWMERVPFSTSTLLLAAARYLDAGGKPSPRLPRVVIEPEQQEVPVSEERARWVVRVSVPTGWHLQPIVEGGEIVEIEVAGVSEPQVGVPPGDLSKGFEFHIVGSPPEGKEGEAKARVRFQVCSDRECMPAEEREISLVWFRR
jgi:uncharacterized protein YyaL (SSP411 family)